MPFLFSFVLIVVAYLIRRRVEESPVFEEMKQRKKESSAPLKELLTTHKRSVLLTALIFAANNAAGYMIIVFFASYASNAVGFSTTDTLIASLVGALGWFIFTYFGGWVSDRIGRVLTYQIGFGILILWCIPMWFLIDTGSLFLFALAVFVLTIGLGPSYGPQSALYAEMFPADVRFSGVSIGYAFGSIMGGAFAATIAQAIYDATGQVDDRPLPLRAVADLTPRGLVGPEVPAGHRPARDPGGRDVPGPGVRHRTVTGTAGRATLDEQRRMSGAG